MMLDIRPSVKCCNYKMQHLSGNHVYSFLKSFVKKIFIDFSPLITRIFYKSTRGRFKLNSNKNFRHLFFLQIVGIWA